MRGDMSIDDIIRKLADGATLEGPHWTEPVKVLAVKARGSRVEVQAVGLHTKRLWNKLLKAEDFTDSIRITQAGELKAGQTEQELLQSHPWDRSWNLSHFRSDSSSHRRGVSRADRGMRRRTPLGVQQSARSQVERKLWHAQAGRGRAGQAFELGEPGLVDGATANSLAAGRYGPPRDGQLAKTKLPSGSCLRMLDQSPGPTQDPLQGTGRLSSPARGLDCSGVGWTPRQITPATAQFTANSHSGRCRAAFVHALVGSEPLSRIR